MFADEAHAARDISSHEASEWQWLFFASDGTPLEAHVSGAPLRPGTFSGIYALRACADQLGVLGLAALGLSTVRPRSRRACSLE